MNDTELIIAAGGQTAVANAINKNLRDGDKPVSPQRVNGWKASNKIPPYFKLAYKRVFSQNKQGDPEVVEATLKSP